MPAAEKHAALKQQLGNVQSILKLHSMELAIPAGSV
jgi:hypothetical protein